MSDSELSTSADMPDNANIEQVLRQVVREALAKNEEITVNLARSRAESRLGLDFGFLKDVSDWKQKSKAIISAAVEEPPSPAKQAKVTPKPQSPNADNAKKRKSTNASAVSKRRKKIAQSESDEEEDTSSNSEHDAGFKSSEKEPAEAADDTSKSNVDSGRKLANDDSNLSEPLSDEGNPSAQQFSGRPNDDDDSDVSLVIDDAPPRKRQRKSSTVEVKTKSKASSKAKAAPKSKEATKELSPDEEEIKRLQGWLLKCGVRKLWHRELAPYDTSKGKIQHLKKLLTDIGMTGRFSVEKAKSIKERRELAAELEAAQTFNQQWGHSDGEDAENGEGGARPRRAAPKGLIDFGDSGDDSG